MDFQVPKIGNINFPLMGEALFFQPPVFMALELLCCGLKNFDNSINFLQAWGVIAFPNRNQPGQGKRGSTWCPSDARAKTIA